VQDVYNVDRRDRMKYAVYGRCNGIGNGITVHAKSRPSRLLLAVIQKEGDIQKTVQYNCNRCCIGSRLTGGTILCVFVAGVIIS
jgi:hypothetical protein